jgi:hypothetical protein
VGPTADLDCLEKILAPLSGSNIKVKNLHNEKRVIVVAGMGYEEQTHYNRKILKESD